MQQEIARDISERLRLRLPGEERQLNKGGTTNAEAYQLYLRGRYSWNKRADGIKKAIEQFQQAIDSDEAMAVLKELKEKHKKREALGQYIAAVHAGFGDTDQAYARRHK